MTLASTLIRDGDIAELRRELSRLRAENERLRAALAEIRRRELRMASTTDATRNAFREAAMETYNRIGEVLALNEQSGDEAKQ